MFRTRLLIMSLFVLSLFNTVFANPPSYIKTSDGVIVFTDPMFTGSLHSVKLEVVDAHVIRVIAIPGKEFSRRQSLITSYTKKSNVYWNLVPAKNQLMLKTKALSAIINLNTGAVSFSDINGKKIVSEKKINGRHFETAIYEGQRLLKLDQHFETTPDDAWYGLGQHQDGVYNYKGEQVNFFQNNTEVAIPFLISCKNYGILWDNYSLTCAGDTRSFHPLSSLQLFSKNNEQGWLNASYYNDSSKPTDLLTQKAEAVINMEFLHDYKDYLPADFNAAKGKVIWEGSIASDFNGIHKLRFTFGGSLKVWLNNELLVDRWRKAWNPAPVLLSVNMTKGAKVPIKIEWTPESNESYISFKWQEPATPEQQNSFGFASEAGQQIDYYFIYGRNMDEVIAGYRKLTGKAPIVPKWALGFWQSRERYKTQQEILEVVSEFRKRKIPLDNIVLDWSYWKVDDWGSQDFDATRFPSPDSMIDVLHKQYNTHFMISVWPKFYEGIPAYQDFDKKGWLYKRNIADRQRDWIGKGYVSTFYDAFNEEARHGFWDLIHKKIYSKGIDAWWMDASEPDILSNVSPERRKQQMSPTALGTAAEYANAYPLQNAKGIYEGQRKVDPNKRVYLLTRSGFAGSQRYAAAIWSGDIGATWHDMKTQIPAGINFSMSGLPYWTMDIGGFVVAQRFEKPTEKDTEEWRELQARWYQFGAFVPIFRAHGQYPYREIFNIAPEQHPAYQSILYYIQLRYRLLPYIYSLAGMSYHDDYTIMRGLVMDFPKDPAVLNIGDQYMFGPSLLINPVCEYKKRERKLYLPKGQGWYDLYTGKWYEGGQTITATADMERMPIYVKGGSIIPFGPNLQYTHEKPADTISLFVYTGQNASFTLYEDEGNNYDYENGSFSTIPVTYNESAKTVTIGDRKGSFAGMLNKRMFRIRLISSSSARGIDDTVAFDKEITYEGEKTTMKF